MNISDEALFYGGCVLAAVSGILLVVCLFIMKIKTVKLNTQLDAEYGESGDV